MNLAKSVLKKYTPIYALYDEDTIKDGQQVTIGGIITGCNIRNTKMGESMAILSLEDQTGKIDVVVFPKNYRTCVRDIFQENVVCVEGRYAVDERETKIIATSVRKLPKQITQVRIGIAAHLENALVQRELKRIFDKYKGEDEVYLHLLGSKKIVRTDKSFWVDSSKVGFKEEVKKLLGADCFI